VISTLANVPWMDLAPYLIGLFFVSYLIGSIPFGLFFAKAAGAGDIRSIGSGNIGATNVLRTGKKWAAALTLLCDTAKGVVAVLLGLIYAEQSFGVRGDVFAVIGGLGAFIGHVFPIWLRFRGGKGVATFIGVTLALFWPVGVLTCLSWLATAVIFRVSSLAALVAALVTPFYFVFWYAEDFTLPGRDMLLYALATTLLALLIFYTHRANIRRLRSGTEPRIGAR
jgi:glycerol-3-phosphate acyltransferase PlsY